MCVKSNTSRNSDLDLWQIKCWLTEEVAGSKSFPSQWGTEAGGGSTIPSSVEQKPSEARTDAVSLMVFAVKGGQWAGDKFS